MARIPGGAPDGTRQTTTPPAGRVARVFTLLAAPCGVRLPAVVTENLRALDEVMAVGM
jgi:hypothetical protein